MEYGLLFTIKFLIKLTKDIPDCEAVVLSQDRFMKKFDHVTCYPWQQGILKFFPEIEKSITPP